MPEDAGIPRPEDPSREEPGAATAAPPAAPGVFLGHLDASIDQANQVVSAAETVIVHASLLAIALIAARADPAAGTVTFDECVTPGCSHLVVTGGFADDGEAGDAIDEYARNLRRDNNALWGPFIGATPAGRFVLDIAKALTLPHPSSQAGYTRGEVKYGAGQTPGRDGNPSPTRYFPAPVDERALQEDRHLSRDY